MFSQKVKNPAYWLIAAAVYTALAGCANTSSMPKMTVENDDVGDVDPNSDTHQRSMERPREFRQITVKNPIEPDSMKGVVVLSLPRFKRPVEVELTRINPLNGSPQPLKGVETIVARSHDGCSSDNSDPIKAFEIPTGTYTISRISVVPKRTHSEQRALTIECPRTVTTITHPVYMSRPGSVPMGASVGALAFLVGAMIVNEAVKDYEFDPEKATLNLTGPGKTPKKSNSFHVSAQHLVYIGDFNVTPEEKVTTEERTVVTDPEAWKSAGKEDEDSADTYQTSTQYIGHYNYRFSLEYGFHPQSIGKFLEETGLSSYKRNAVELELLGQKKMVIKEFAVTPEN